MNRYSKSEKETALKNATLPAGREEFTFQWAAEYYDRGWSVIPLEGKRPALRSWSKFQTEHATPSELKCWFAGKSVSNVGIVTGRLSGIVVVDCDSSDDAEYWTRNFPETPLAVRTGGGGAHFYYHYPTGETIGNRAKILSRQIDLRGEGGYIVAPPSIHPNGTHYEWLSRNHEQLESVPIFLPEWIADSDQAEKCSTSRHSVKCPARYIRSIRALSGEGGHNQTYRAACILRDSGLSPEEAFCELVIWNKTNATPPWSVRELLHKVQSAFKT